MQIKEVKFGLRQDVKSNWDLVEETLVLSSGEPIVIFEGPNVYIKFGDGHSVVKNLPYAQHPEIVRKDDINQLIEGQKTFKYIVLPIEIPEVNEEEIANGSIWIES